MVEVTGSYLDAFVGWVEADSVRETVASVAGCVLVALAVVGAVFLAEHTTADVAVWWRARRFQASCRRTARTVVPRVHLAVEVTVHQPAPEVLPDPVVEDCRRGAAEAAQEALNGALRVAEEGWQPPVWGQPSSPPLRPEPATDLFAGWSQAQIKRAVEDLIVEARREYRQVFGHGGAS